MQFQMAMPPTKRCKQSLKLLDGSWAQPGSKVKMQGDTVFDSIQLRVSLRFCDQNHKPWAHAYCAKQQF